MSMFTVVVGFRNRESERIARFLRSLADQTFTDFSLIFVDYGSAPDYAATIRPLVEQYAFAHYVYSDTRGWPWSRSKALNVGARLAESEYTITTDTDMLFPPHFLATVAAHATPQRVLYCAPHFLPEGFSDWAHPERHLDQLGRGDRKQFGGFQCIATRTMHQIRGFDEYYRYWGTEDRDLYFRLLALDFEVRWLNDYVFFFHQWHPPANYLTRNLMPDGTWGRIVIHSLQQRGIVERNTADWGRVYTSAERPVFRFVDLDTSRLIESDALRLFDELPVSNHSVNRAARIFSELPVGFALAVNHAFYPEPNPWADRMIRYGNRLLQRMGANTHLYYRSNILHAFLVEFIERNESLVSDYFLDFPALQGVSVLVRA